MPRVSNDYDVERWREYIEEASQWLAASQGAEPERARNALLKLANEGFIDIVPPPRKPTIAQLLTTNPGERTMSSYKPGNVVVNLRRNPEGAVKILCDSVVKGAELGAQQPIFAFLSLISALIGASKMWKLTISENGAAIILALQNRGERLNFSAEEERCRRDANKLLKAEGRGTMNETAFAHETDLLLHCGCVEMENGVISLRERVKGTF